MKITFCTHLFFLIFTPSLLAQINNKSDSTMTMISNKEIVITMYQTVLNQKQMEALGQFVDSNYMELFSNQNKPLMRAFPNIQFTIKEIFADGNKVVTHYDWSGTHLGEYQGIPATTKNVRVEGISIYELKDGKIINSIAKPDKLSFFVQLGLVPTDFIVKNAAKDDWVYFVDEFEIPEKSYQTFKEKLDYNRNFISKLNGFIKDEVIIKTDESKNITIINIAVWQNEQCLTNAKKSVQEEYARIHFNPKLFNKKLNIKMKRDSYLYLE